MTKRHAVLVLAPLLWLLAAALAAAAPPSSSPGATGPAAAPRGSPASTRPPVPSASASPAPSIRISRRSTPTTGPGSPSPAAVPAAQPTIPARIASLTATFRQALAEDSRLKSRIDRDAKNEEKPQLLDGAGHLVDELTGYLASLAAGSQECSRITSDTARLGDDRAAIETALTEHRAQAARPLQELAALVRTEEDVQRLTEELRLAGLEQGALDAEIASIKQELTQALKRQDDASRDNKAASSTLTRLAEAFATTLKRGSDGPSDLGQELLARHRALDDLRREGLDLREALARLRVDWLNLRVDQASRKQELARLRQVVIQKMLQNRRPSVAISEKDVTKAAEASQQEKAEADKLRQQGEKAAVEAETERAEAQKLQEKAQRRDKEIQRGVSRGEEQEVLDQKRRLLSEELQLAEDKVGLAAERSQLAEAAGRVADAKTLLGSEQVAHTQELARVVAGVVRRPGDSGPPTTARGALRRDQRETQRKLEELSKQETALVEALQLQKRRRTVIRDRLERERGGRTRDRGIDREILRALKDQEQVCDLRIEAVTRQLDLTSHCVRTYKELLQFYKENLATLDLYRTPEPEKVTVSSLREGLLTFQALAVALPGRIRASKEEVRIWWSNAGNRARASEHGRLLLILGLVAIVAAAVVRRAGEAWARNWGGWAGHTVAVLKRTWTPLGLYLAVQVGLSSGRAAVPWAATAALPLLYLAGYRLAASVIRRVSRRPTEAGVASEDDVETPARPFRERIRPWLIWALRYAAMVFLVTDLMVATEAAAPLVLVVRFASQLGLLLLFLAFLIANKGAVVNLLQVPEAGQAARVWELYNAALGRLYVLLVLATVLVIGLKVAGHNEIANYFVTSSVWSFVAFGTALMLFRLGRRRISAISRALSGGPTTDRVAVLGESALGILLGIATAVVWVDIWSPQLTTYQIVTSTGAVELAWRLGCSLAIAASGVGLTGAAAWGIERFFSTLRPLDAQGAAYRRSRTLQPLLISVARYFIYFIAGIFVLRQLGFDPTPLLAGAGVVGVAVGFGAQSLVKDVITGFFILAEDLVGVGDWVEIDGNNGQVEAVTVRSTQIRLYTGELRTIPNSEIRQIGNFSRGFMRGLVFVSIAYDSDLDRAMAQLGNLAREYHDANRAVMLGPPEVHGVHAWNATEIQIRVVFMVKPDDYVRVEREFRVIVKREFDRLGIEFPFVRQRLYGPGEPPRQRRDNGDGQP